MEGKIRKVRGPGHSVKRAGYWQIANAYSIPVYATYKTKRLKYALAHPEESIEFLDVSIHGEGMEFTPYSMFLETLKKVKSLLYFRAKNSDEDNAHVCRLFENLQKVLACRTTNFGSSDVAYVNLCDWCRMTVYLCLNYSELELDKSTSMATLIKNYRAQPEKYFAAWYNCTKNSIRLCPTEMKFGALAYLSLYDVELILDADSVPKALEDPAPAVPQLSVPAGQSMDKLAVKEHLKVLPQGNTFNFFFLGQSTTDNIQMAITQLQELLKKTGNN